MIEKLVHKMSRAFIREICGKDYANLSFRDVALAFPSNERDYVEEVYRYPGSGYGRDLP